MRIASLGPARIGGCRTRIWTRHWRNELEGKIKQATVAAQDIYGQAKDAAADAYGKAKEAAGDAARSVQEHAAPWEEFLRNAIESRPYTSVAVALGLGWFIGRMGGHSDYWER